MGSSPRRFAVSATLVLVLALSGLATTVTTAFAQGLGAPTVTGQLVRGEAPDYATELFGDAWDYANREDVQTDPGPVINAEISLSGDQLHVAMDSTGHFHPIWPGWPGGLRLGRDGPVNPVDSTRYDHLSFRIHSSVWTTGQVIWQTCPDIIDGCEGQAAFTLHDTGWQTITVDLRDGSGEPWSGELQALRLTIGLANPATFDVDWMRLHGSADPAAVSYTNAGFGTAELRWDADSDPGNNTPDNPGWGVLGTTDGLTGRAEFDVAAYPPGTYRFHTVSGGTTSAYSSPLTIEGAPRVRILNPDITGGEDFATAVLGDPWDFSNPEDIADYNNIANASFADGKFHGNNDLAGDNPRDPFIVLSGLGDLDADRYHRFTVTATYEGPFDLSWDPGGGTHGRISWRQDGHHLWQQTQAVVNYTDIDTYTVVLGSDPRTAVMEPDLGPQPGWGTGATTHELRWDINEDNGPKRWAIDEIRLAADDESHGQFDIEWVDDAHQPGTTVSFYADSDEQGFDGQLIASGVTGADGVNRYTWDTSGLAEGTYWVHAEATSPNGVATQRTYATGPVRVHAPTDRDGGEPDGLRLAGADRILTGIELSQAGFPGVVHTAIVATAGQFPDALAAAPLAAAIDAPLLLNSADRLAPAVRTELERLQVERVILLGGTAAQSQAVEDELRSFVGIVDRAAGVDRFHTASIVAERAVEEWRIRGVEAGPPLVALGSRFEDALSAASLAGHGRRPLLLASHDRLPDWTARSLDRLGATAATVVGGRGIIEAGLMDALRQRVGNVDELAGNDHVETAAMVAEQAVAHGARRDIVVVASGDAFPDALAAGPSAIAQGGVLLLTPRDRAGDQTAAFLSAGSTSRLWIAGGPAAVSEPTGAALADAAGLR